MSTQSKAGKGHPCSPLTTLCIAIALASTGVALPLTYVLADNLPQGGQVIGGQATISQQGNRMDVNTSSARTAINWQRFNVGPDHRITFNQPDGKSVTLNRVIGGDPSKIYGAITSNGQLILVNPNGVMIGPKAHISSSALVASAGFLTEEQARQFAATGKLDIQLTGQVTNQGRITVHDNGMVALLGAQVNNAGVIQARKGRVQLATGPATTLDFHGDGLLNIAVGGTPGDKDSVNADVTGGVHNSGEIDVGNGTVAMSAQRAARHLDSVINLGGNVAANSVGEDGGTIVLGNSARTSVTGTLSATGVNGGQVKVLGDEVNVAGTAKLDASGTQGRGGKVLVGGSYQGKGPEQAAKSTTVAKGAQLKADGHSDGGQVVAWSDGKTHFAGSASAQGGQNGGVVETSGKQLTIAPEAQVSTRGGRQSGKWLLDPETVNIEADGGAAGSDTVSASAIAAGLKNGDVEITASNRINVNSAIVAPDATGNTLRLLANGSVAPISDYQDTGNALADAKRNDSGSVYINAPILLKNGHLFILATGDVLLNDQSNGKTGDAAYLGRAIIDVGNGTVWIKTSNSASVIQEANTALIGDKVAVQGASVLLQSPLNYAGTLAGKAGNGVFHYNQTSSDGVNTGKVDIQHEGLTESLDGVKAQTIEKLGQQTIWNRMGDEVHPLSYNGQSFEYLIFEAIDYVDNKGTPIDMSDKKFSALADTDYKVKSISFIDSATGDRWTISSNPNVASLLNVLKNGVATTELPPGFSLSAAQGAVVSDADGWGVLGGAGDQGKSPQMPGITDNRATGQRDQLLVDLGGHTTEAQTNFTSMWHDANAYERGVVTFLGSQDNSTTGGVQLNAQKAQLEGKVADAQREYGEANPAFSASIDLADNASANSRAVKGVDDFVDRQLNQNRFDAKVTPSTDAIASSNVGDYKVGGSLDASGYIGQRYETSVKEGNLKVTPAELTVTARDKSKTYGDKDPQLDYEVAGTKLGQTGTDLLNGGTLSRQAGEDVGDYGINQGELGLNNGLGGNYKLIFVDGRLAITPATLTVTADNTGKVYGDQEPALTYRVDGLKNGDTQGAVLNDGALRRDAGENVGTYDIGNGGLALTQGRGSNYILQFKDGVFTIAPAELTVTADGKAKVYGDADPELTYKVSGLKNGDTQGSVLNNSGALSRASGEDVGQYAIGQGGVGLNTQAGSNYILHYVEGQFEITPATLTVTADGKTKVYADLDPKLSFSVSGLKNNDEQADVLGGKLGRAAGENVGAYAIDKGSLEVLGQNYVLSFVGNDFTITPATLTVRADSNTKVYGDLDPTLSYQVHGLKGSDSAADVLNDGQVARQTGENVGDYRIGQGSLDVKANSNYVLTFVDGKLAITPATLTVTAQDKSKVYGDADPALTHVVSGLKNGDSSASVLDGGTLVRDAGENVNAGGYTIHRGSVGLNNDQGSNYVLQFVEGKLTITPAALTVTADNNGKVYGDLDPALSYQVHGLKGSDSAADVLNGGQVARQAGENVGDYRIGQGSVGLNEDKGQNYILTYQDGTFSVTPAILMVRADDKGKVYGEIDPELSYQVSGLKNGDAQGSVLSGNIGRQAGENVKADGYAIGQGDLASTSQNYLLHYQVGTFTITPATLQIDFDDHSKVYGEIDPKLTYRVSGLVNGDTSETVLNGGSPARAAGENVGNYAIGEGALGANANYILTFKEGQLAITPAELTVTADHKTKVYGDLDPELTYSIAGLKRGDSATSVVGGDLARISGEKVKGAGYAITQGNVVLSSGNYTMVFKDGNLRITPAQLTVSADNQSKTTGQADPALTYQVSGLKNGDSAALVKGSLSREPGETAGTYAIGQGRAFEAGSNYTVVFREGAMTITGPLAPVDPVAPDTPPLPATPLGPLPVTAQSPGNTRCTALESPSAASANYTVSPAVARTYAVQLICKPRAYGDKTSTTPDIRDVLEYANSHFKDGKFFVPDWNRSVIPHDLKVPSKGGK